MRADVCALDRSTSGLPQRASFCVCVRLSQCLLFFCVVRVVSYSMHTFAHARPRPVTLSMDRAGAAIPCRHGAAAGA